MKEFFSSLDRTRKIQLAVGLVLLVLTTVALLVWLLTPSKKLLFGNLRERDAAEITQALTEWKVPYQIVDGGAAIEVPADAVYDTRMKLVASGIPKGGHAGFELFDDADFGVTEFAQRVNYQRALQGEIERTISRLPGVAEVRVHLTIRKPGLFVGDQESSKASVALTLQPGIQLSAQQIDGVRSLVAASVEGLAPGQVSVLGSDGSLLAAAQPDGGDKLMAFGDEESRVEIDVRSKIEHLLSQIVPGEDFRVSVDATINMDKVREVSERPTSQGDTGNDLLSRQRTSNSHTSEGSRAQSELETEFVHGVARTEISRAQGRIERLSIAVLIPAGVKGIDLRQVRELVKAASGADEARGDVINVTRLGSADAARSNAPEAAPHPGSPALHRVSGDGWVWAIGGLLLCLLAFFAWRFSRSTPQRLTHAQREDALARMQAWLAKGDAA